MYFFSPIDISIKYALAGITNYEQVLFRSQTQYFERLSFRKVTYVLLEVSIHRQRFYFFGIREEKKSSPIEANGCPATLVRLPLDRVALQLQLGRRFVIEEINGADGEGLEVDKWPKVFFLVRNGRTLLRDFSFGFCGCQIDVVVKEEAMFSKVYTKITFFYLFFVKVDTFWLPPFFH